MGALTDWRALPSLPRCSDERRDWIAAPCDDRRVWQSNRRRKPHPSDLSDLRTLAELYFTTKKGHRA